MPKKKSIIVSIFEKEQMTSYASVVQVQLDSDSSRVINYGKPISEIVKTCITLIQRSFVTPTHNFIFIVFHVLSSI